MLSDNNRIVNQLAVSIITSARLKGEACIRIFKIPRINCYANNYYELIDYTDDWLEYRLTIDIAIHYYCRINSSHIDMIGSLS